MLDALVSFAFVALAEEADNLWVQSQQVVFEVAHVACKRLEPMHKHVQVHFLFKQVGTLRFLARGLAPSLNLFFDDDWKFT